MWHRLSDSTVAKRIWMKWWEVNFEIRLLKDCVSGLGCIFSLAYPHLLFTPFHSYCSTLLKAISWATLQIHQCRTELKVANSSHKSFRALFKPNFISLLHWSVLWVLSQKLEVVNFKGKDNICIIDLPFRVKLNLSFLA